MLCKTIQILLINLSVQFFSRLINKVLHHTLLNEREHADIYWTPTVLAKLKKKNYMHAYFNIALIEQLTCLRIGSALMLSGSGTGLARVCPWCCLRAG